MDKKISWLQLIRSENVGPITFWLLLKNFGSAEHALEKLPELSARGGREVIAHPQRTAEKEIESFQKTNYHLIAAFEDTFPPILRQLPDCPPFISVYGDPSYLKRPNLGIVGSRNASIQSKRLAGRISKDLADAGWCIVSGLARGIDRCAHEGALESEIIHKTGTVAVVAGGIDVTYPKEHETLYKQITEYGAVISEMPLGTPPTASLFPRRNRLISGLSRGVIVVEAGFESGSLITARYALEQNREVFAIPGSPLDPRCRGTNDLIRNGAIVTESAEDILNILGVVDEDDMQLQESPKTAYQPKEIDILLTEGQKPPLSFGEDLANLRQQILSSLTSYPLSIDDLLDQYDVPINHILTVLLELELAGQVARHANNRVSLLSLKRVA